MTKARMDDVQLMAKALWKAACFDTLPIEHVSPDLRRHYEEMADYALAEMLAHGYVLTKTANTASLAKRLTDISLRRTERRRNRKQIA